jgi:FHA domain
MAALAAAALPAVYFYLEPSGENVAQHSIQLNNGQNNILGRSKELLIKDPYISREHIHMKVTLITPDAEVTMTQVGSRESSVNGDVIRTSGVKRLKVNDVICFLSNSKAHEYTLRLRTNDTEKNVVASVNSKNAAIASPTKIVVSPPIIAVAIPIPQIPTGAPPIIAVAVPIPQIPTGAPPVFAVAVPISQIPTGVVAANVLHERSLPCYSKNMCSLPNNINVATLLASKTVVAYTQSNALTNAAITIKEMVAKLGQSILESRKGLIVFNNDGDITLQLTSTNNLYDTRVGYTVKSEGELVPQDLVLSCTCVAFRKASGNTQCTLSQGRNIRTDKNTKNHCKHTIVITALHFFTEIELCLFLD